MLSPLGQIAVFDEERLWPYLNATIFKNSLYSSKTWWEKERKLVIKLYFDLCYLFTSDLNQWILKCLVFSGMVKESYSWDEYSK
jgi:hypothetical protein